MFWFVVPSVVSVSYQYCHLSRGFSKFISCNKFVMYIQQSFIKFRTPNLSLDLVCWCSNLFQLSFFLFLCTQTHRENLMNFSFCYPNVSYIWIISLRSGSSHVLNFLIKQEIFHVQKFCKWVSFAFLNFIHLQKVQVYNVTKFLEDHPGGDDVLLSSTGLYKHIYHHSLPALILKLPNSLSGDWSIGFWSFFSFQVRMQRMILRTWVTARVQEKWWSSTT